MGSREGDQDPVVLAGTSNPELARAVGEALGVSLGALRVERFPDGELHVELGELVRGRAVYVLQSTGAPVGEALLELLLIADASHRAGAKRVVALLPYVGFARQDRRKREGEPLGIGVVADILAQGRFERIVALDVHAPASEGCFRAPLDHVTAMSRLAEALRPHADEGAVVVAPDAGAARTARELGRMLDLPFAHIDKTRRAAEEVEMTDVVGDVEGRRPIVVDDMISTGGTIATSLTALAERGARTGALVAATHLVPSAGAGARLASLPIERVFATDSLPPPSGWTIPLERVSVGPLFADVIGRMERGASLADLLSVR